ncbi:MAG: hypothetical protein AVO35_12220 [Candidatus Aegiribacteria sp. MLS_C]|nr:MAG: hypothetical protein AVO35_12220 [Candidatus Aegiribacteria sp. MLS_C]
MTGLLGGTFDPPHYGHLVLAMEACTRFALRGVILVPSRLPPHKGGGSVTPFHHRLEMTRLAAEGADELSAEDLESESGPSWTVNLLEKLSGQGMRICFIMGMDSLTELHTWRDPHRIASLARMVAGTRPGFDPSRAAPGILSLVETFDMPGMCISSSQLRERFAEGLNTRYLLPEKVRDYIRENDLYARGKGC